jgi:hypothetical protein
VSGGTIGGSIANTQVAFGSAANIIAGDPNFTWLTGSKKLSLGDSLAGLSGSTQVPGGTVNVQGILHPAIASPIYTGLAGIIQSDSSVDNTANNLTGGFFSSNATGILNSSISGGAIVGVTGYGTASHASGTNGKVLGSYFQAQKVGAGAVTDLAGVAGQVNLSSTGLAASAFALEAYLPVISGTPPTKVGGLTIGAQNGGVSNFGILINNQVQDSSHWAVQSGAGRVEFGDNLDAAGSVPTITGTGACATISTQLGGAWNFSFKCTGTTGASTITVTFLQSQTNGYHCEASDETTVADKPNQTSHTATTCVLTTTTTVSNDTILVNAFGF